MLGFPQSSGLKINAGSFLNFHLKYPFNSQSLHFQNSEHEVSRSHRGRDWDPSLCPSKSHSGGRKWYHRYFLNLFPLSNRILTKSVNDDGSTNIDGETGITTNAQGQTTNVGGSGGITIIPNENTGTKGNKNTTAAGASGNRTTSATKPKGTGSGVSDLTALLNALSGEGGAAPKINGTATTVAPQAQPEAVIGEGAKAE